MANTIRQLIPKADFARMLLVGSQFEYVYRGMEHVQEHDELRLISWDGDTDQPTGESVTWVVRKVIPEGPHIRLKGYST